jgi:Cu/Zn superoxide dismutase
MRGWMLGGSLALGLAGAAEAADLTVTMHKIDASGVGEAVGTVTISGGNGGGAVFTTDLGSLPAGQHGFHVHANADCGPGPNDQGQVVAGGAAGGHWDPEGTKQHRGPRAPVISATCRRSPSPRTARPRSGWRRPGSPASTGSRATR